MAHRAEITAPGLPVSKLERVKWRRGGRTGADFYLTALTRFQRTRALAITAKTSPWSPRKTWELLSTMIQTSAMTLSFRTVGRSKDGVQTVLRPSEPDIR